MNASILDLGKLLRTAQTFVPWLLESKYWAQYQHRKLMRRPFERDFELLAKFDPDPSEPFIDIGGNRGQSVQAIRIFKPLCSIWSFEPSQFTYDRLYRYTSHYDGVKTVHAGLGETKSQLTLFTPIYRGFVFDGLSSTTRAAAADWLVGRIYGFDAKKLEIKEEKIDIFPLDRYELNPAIIKVDVQGAEMEVLLGAAATIKRSRPLILMESPRDNVESAWLADLGYQQYTWRNGRLNLDKNGVNAWFVPTERAEQLSSEVLSID